MDFKLGEKEKVLIDEIAKFAKKELPPGWKGTQLIDQECMDFDFEVSMSKKLARKGWLVMSWPKEYGGQDASHLEQTVYEMEVSYWGIPGAWMGISGIQWVGPVLIMLGTEQQKRKYLPMIASGDRDGYWCTGYSEPNAGSDLASLQTRAVKQGDHYVINGQKVWTSFAHNSRWCWLMARTDPNAPKKHRGLSLFIVDMKSPGITIRPLPNYYSRHHFNEVFFDNVKVPAENLVGEENRGWYHLMQALAFERRSVGPIIAGGFKRMVEDLAQYCKETTYEGKRLCQHPIVRQKLAEMAIDVETIKMFAFQFTWRLTQGAIPVYEASRNKLTGDEIMRRFATSAADILGAYSQLDPDSKLARVRGRIQGAYLGFPGNMIAAGTGEVEKSIIAQFKLGLPKSY
ncbi:MAG: acyl-CoA dehydrogenase [Chloroflexi bacterium]|nr:acyl-CoA dehydrogenase [Chloroflexota bacterium]